MLIVSVFIFALLFDMQMLVELLGPTMNVPVPAWVFTTFTVVICVSAGFVLLCSLLSLISGKRWKQAIIGAVALLVVSVYYTLFSNLLYPIFRDWLLWWWLATGGLLVITVLLAIRCRKKTAQRKKTSSTKRKAARRRKK